MTAGAIRDTASILRDRIVAIAAHKFEASVEDIEIAESRASVRGTPSIGMSLEEIAALAYFDPYSLPPGMPAGLEASSRYTAEARFDLGERLPPVYLRGRRRPPAASSSCATS